ncbi:MAG: glycosyltransferase family 4 protein [Salinirussus sp.]
MHVAYLTTYYNGRVDGRFGRFHDWVHTLREMEDPPFEFDVVALTASNPDETLSSRPHGFLGDATDLWGSAANNVEFLLNVPRALRDLRALDPDVVHVLTLDLIAYPIAVALSGRSPVVGPDVQGYFPGRSGDRWNQGGLAGIKNLLRYRLRGRLIDLSTDPRLVALSRYHADNVRKLGVNGRVEVIPPGVSSIFRPDTAGEATGDGDPTEFLYLGDLSQYKGYELFVDALAALPDSVDFRATVVGSGDPDRSRLGELGLADRIDVAGFVDRADIPEYYRRADAYVMPSIDENGPNTIVESLACGTPVVATDRPGINEYVPEEAAVYVDRTRAGLRRGMERIHRHRATYAAAARDLASEYRAVHTVDALADLYEAHLKGIESREN